MHQGVSRAGPVRVAGQDLVNLPQEKLLAIPDLQQMRIGQSRPAVMTMTELRRETTTIPGGFEEHQHYQFFDQGYSEVGNQQQRVTGNVQVLDHMGRTGGQGGGYNEMPQLSHQNIGFQQAAPIALRNTGGMQTGSPASFEQHQQYQFYSQGAQGVTGIPIRAPDNVQGVDTGCSIIGQGLVNNAQSVQGNSFEQTPVGRKAGMSTASRDLEDLMTSISEFDVSINIESI